MDDLINDRTRRGLRFETNGSSFDLDRSSVEDDRLSSPFETEKTKEKKSSAYSISNILPAFIDRYICKRNIRPLRHTRITLNINHKAVYIYSFPLWMGHIEYLFFG